MARSRSKAAPRLTRDAERLIALANGLGDAAKGADRLASGAGKLADGVASGAKQIPSYDKAERENLAKVVAQPISRTGLDALVTPRLALASLLPALATAPAVAVLPVAAVKALDAYVALALGYSFLLKRWPAVDVAVPLQPGASSPPEAPSEPSAPSAAEIPADPVPDGPLRPPTEPLPRVGSDSPPLIASWTLSLRVETLHCCCLH